LKYIADSQVLSPALFVYFAGKLTTFSAILYDFENNIGICYLEHNSK